MKTFAWTAAVALGLFSTAPQAAPKEPVGALEGVITLKGPPPKRRKIAVDGDPKCAAMHATEPLLSDEVVADEKGRLQWALISIKEGLGERKFEAPKTPVVLEQKGCRFEPHVFGVMAGQEVLFRNHDELVHIIHVKPNRNREFGFSQQHVGEERTKVFANRETIRVFCDVHSWMSAWAVVLDHPFHTVSAADGAYSLKGLPPGKYTVEVWHEKFKPVTQEVEVKAGATTALSVELGDKP